MLETTSGGEVSIDVKSSHLFRYASEWDPREPGHTKGGYLEGKLRLPNEGADGLRIVISTRPDSPLDLESEVVRQVPGIQYAHPTILYVVRKGASGRRHSELEAVANHKHWRQEFHLVNRQVRIVNQTSEVDEDRYSSIAPLQPIDDMFRIEDNVIDIGKGAGELNLIILIPKTEARAQGGEVTLKKILLDRVGNGNRGSVFQRKIGEFASKDTSNEELAAKVLKRYKGKMSSNVKKVRLMVEVFNLRTNELLGHASSQPICDSSSKEHGALDFHTAFPLRCCAKGGRKVFMVCDSALAKDVEPRFQIYSQGRHLEDKDDLLQQPRLAGGQQVLVMKETLVFITPPQPHIETIMENGWKIKLVGLRLSDKNISKTKFDFEYFPSDFYDPCIFCELQADGPSFPASLPALVGPARPGVKKRRMPEQKLTFAATAKALRLIRKPRIYEPPVLASPVPIPLTTTKPRLHEPSVPVSPIPIPLSTTTTATSSSKLLELLAISPPVPGSHSATKTPHITKQQSFTELNQPSSTFVTKQRLSTSPTSIPTSDKEVVTLSRSPSPTSNSSSSISTNLPIPEIKAETKIPLLPQFRVVSREHPEEAVEVKKAPAGKHLWLDTREKGDPTQAERPPIIAFSPEKLPPTIQGRPSLITQALLTARKNQQGLSPAIQSKQEGPQDKMSGITNKEREVSSKVAFDPRPQSQFELPAGIPKMPGLIDLNLVKARAESKVTQSGWIPKRPVETLSRSIMEREAEARLKQQSSLEHINLKALLQQPTSGLQTADLGESGRPVQKKKKEGRSLQSLHQLALRLTPHKPPTGSDDHHTHAKEPRGSGGETGQGFKSALQLANSFPSRMTVVPGAQFRNRMMVVPDEKKTKLSLSSGLNSSLSYEDEDEDDRPLVIDTDESGKKTESDKRTKLGKQQSQGDRTLVPSFHLTPLQEVKKEPWSFEGPFSGFDREQDVSYLTPMEDDDLDDLDSLDRMVGPLQSNQKRGNEPKPEKVECPFCKRFYGKYYINKHMVDQHP